MSLAMKRLKNLGWLALVFLVAIMLYPLSLNVAALHSDLVAVDREILDTKREINFLQAELRTRASLQQLEEWNELLYGYAPPTADQFINGERALAGLTGDAPVMQPVLVAASAASNSSPAALAPQDTEMEEPRRPAAVRPNVEKVDTEAVPPTRTERLARLDEQLLSDDFLRDISAKAAKERAR